MTDPQHHSNADKAGNGADDGASGGWTRYRKPVIALVLVLVLASAAWFLRESWSIDAVKDWVRSLGVWGPLGFAMIYVIATVLFIPGSALTLAGGAMFGPVWGTFYNLTAATVGATIAFLVARYLAGDWAEQRSAGRLLKIKHGVEAEGWRFVVFVRLVPLFPFNLLNYALGLTRIPLLQYMLASYLAMLPGAFAYTYLGHVGSEALEGHGTLRAGLLALALLAVVGFLPGFIKRWRSARATNQQG